MRQPPALYPVELLLVWVEECRRGDTPCWAYTAEGGDLRIGRIKPLFSPSGDCVPRAVTPCRQGAGTDAGRNPRIPG
jgi:hypothetical protein